MVLPTLALAIAPIGVLARYVRSSMLENLRQEYVVTARAKGGRESAVLVGHVLRNSLMPLVTVVGPMFASLATGTIFVEQIFGIRSEERRVGEECRPRRARYSAGSRRAGETE